MEFLAVTFGVFMGLALFRAVGDPASSAMRAFWAPRARVVGTLLGALCRVAACLLGGAAFGAGGAYLAIMIGHEESMAFMGAAGAPCGIWASYRGLCAWDRAVARASADGTTD